MVSWLDLKICSSVSSFSSPLKTPSFRMEISRVLQMFTSNLPQNEQIVQLRPEAVVVFRLLKDVWFLKGGKEKNSSPFLRVY